RRAPPLPTRRSSDLDGRHVVSRHQPEDEQTAEDDGRLHREPLPAPVFGTILFPGGCGLGWLGWPPLTERRAQGYIMGASPMPARSEEHTSELQSRDN